MNLNYFKLVYLLVVVLFHGSQYQLYAQESTVVEKEAQLKDLFGLDKLLVLNELTLHYGSRSSRKAIRYGKQALTIGENIFSQSSSVDLAESTHLVCAYFQLGKVQFDRENYFESQDHLQKAQSLSAQINDQTYVAETDMLLLQIDALIKSGKIKENFFSKTLGDLKVGEVISSASRDIAIETEIKLAQTNEKKAAFEVAIDHYEKAVNLLRDKGNTSRINELQIKIAVMLDSLDQHEEAQVYLSDAIIQMEAKQEKISTRLRLDSIQPLSKLERRPPEDLLNEQQNLKDLAETYAKEKNFEKSRAYYQLYQELSQKMAADSLIAEVENERTAQEILLLKQQKYIADLNVETAELEKDKQIRLRNTSIVIGLLISIGTLMTLYFYVAKRREHKKLGIAYRDLDKTRGKLVGAEQRIVKLLRQQVSGDVAQELLMGGTDKPGQELFVCIMFLDIRDFTPMAERLSPEELIKYQNNVFGFMIDVVQQHKGNINQLLGDGFMATFGAPVSHGNDCQNAFLAAKEILQEVKERNEAEVIPKTKIGIGLHAGYVVTGNVGNEARKQYSVTGNPVIIASRVEQLNKDYKTQLIITEEVYEKLDKPLQLNRPFLEVEIKGRSNPVRILKIA